MDYGDVDEQFCLLLVHLAEGWPAVRLRTATFKSYAVGLTGLTLQQVAQACERATRECQFFPSAAELRRFAEPSLEDAALLAWSALQQAASIVGAYASLELEDAAAAQALERTFGSWPAYCDLEGPAVGARRAEFLAHYREARRHTVRQSTKLPGLTDRGAGRITLAGDVLPVERLKALQVAQANRLISGGHQ